MVGSPLEFSGVSQWLGFVIGAVLAVIALGEGQAYFVSMFQVYTGCGVPTCSVATRTVSPV